MDGGIVPVVFQYMVWRKSGTKGGDTFMRCDMGKISKQAHHVILVFSVNKVKIKALLTRASPYNIPTANIPLL